LADNSLAASSDIEDVAGSAEIRDMEILAVEDVHRRGIRGAGSGGAGESE